MRDVFLKTVSRLLHVYIEDTETPLHAKWWVNGEQGHP